MGFILSILGNKYVIIGLVLAAILGGSYFYVSGLKNSVATLTTKNANLTASLKVSQDSVRNLQEAISDQNEAVEKFKSDADERQKVNAVAVAKAQVAANNYKAQASAILSAKLPANTNSCAAANDLINSEIQNAQ